MASDLSFPSATDIDRFYRENTGIEVFRLRLKRPKVAHQDVLIDQVEVRREMSERFGPLIEVPGYIFPSKTRLAQASSCQTAGWKAKKLCHYLDSTPIIWDVTGGSGIDTWGFEQHGAIVHVTEVDAALVDLHRHNGQLLNSERAVHFQPAETFEVTRPFSAIYADPSRIDPQGERVYHPSESAPNPLSELPTWFRAAPWVMIKLSPMVDPEEALRCFPSCRFLWTLSVKREVKEVLLLCHQEIQATLPERWAVDIDLQGVERFAWKIEADRPAPSLSAPKTFLYDADAALVAARGIPTIASHFNLAQLHPESRLLTSDKFFSDFPGRIFELESIHAPFENAWPEGASVVVRGFPEKAEMIRKRMRLKENAEHYLLATCWLDGQRGFLRARRKSA